MDNISFTLEFKQEQKTYDVAVFLNDKKLPHNTFSLGDVLSATAQSFSEFDMFTCTCGHSGCAGFHTCITHRKENGIVHWEFPEDNDYVTDKKIYQFEQTHFENSIKCLKSDICQAEKEGFHSLIIQALDRDDTPYNSEKALNSYFSYYKNRSDLYELIKSEFPQEYNQEYYLQYGSLTDSYSSKLYNLIPIFINQWPYSNVSWIYFARIKYVCHALKDFLYHHNVEKLAHISQYYHQKNGVGFFERFFSEEFLDNMEENWYLFNLKLKDNDTKENI